MIPRLNRSQRVSFIQFISNPSGDFSNITVDNRSIVVPTIRGVPHGDADDQINSTTIKQYYFRFGVLIRVSTFVDDKLEMSVRQRDVKLPEVTAMLDLNYYA